MLLSSLARLPRKAWLYDREKEGGNNRERERAAQTSVRNCLLMAGRNGKWQMAASTTCQDDFPGRRRCGAAGEATTQIHSNRSPSVTSVSREGVHSETHPWRSTYPFFLSSRFMPVAGAVGRPCTGSSQLATAAAFFIEKIVSDATLTANATASIRHHDTIPHTKLIW
ncbi:hypothetical protein L914_18626 [Phytophthora nicotianae]|uniref:Uncharacterized protein n=2 Tax=Phytophthora nicotianae TaxID=4792 RepID=V9E6Y1_PHYNI|nr:hypothetical protein F443_19389 [Phytophthora nicotianae P1569]ETM34263.1 hypothetical protein L914_18626 [Phytophthora nicotianae]